MSTISFFSIIVCTLINGAKIRKKVWDHAHLVPTFFVLLNEIRREWLDFQRVTLFVNKATIG
jgi:hypothetical protein